MSVSKQTPPQEPFDPGTERLLFFDVKKDVYKGQAVIGPAPVDFYKKKILEDLVNQAIKNLKPEIEEKEGYELIKYELVIKQVKTS